MKNFEEKAKLGEFTPLYYKIEVELDPLEAFRLASFGIEYVPQYITGPVMVDRYVRANSYFMASEEERILAYHGWFRESPHGRR